MCRGQSTAGALMMVSIAPGAYVFTVIPYLPNSIAAWLQYGARIYETGMGGKGG
jgi:hypothetical protein